MAKKRKHFSHKNKITVPVAVVMGFAPAVANTVNWTRSGGWQAGSNEFIRIMTGFDQTDHKFHFEKLSYGLFPVLGGLAVHWMAGRFGINRMLGRMGVPLIRL